MPERRRHAASANELVQVLRRLETPDFITISGKRGDQPPAYLTEVYDRPACDDD